MFNKENKVAYKELAPSLQALIDSKATQTQVTQIQNQLGNVRITVSSIAPAGPQNGKEMWYDTGTGLIKRYVNNKWDANNAVYK